MKVYIALCTHRCTHHESVRTLCIPCRLKRGYKDTASHEHRESPIGHLVLIVHGIGQSSDSANIGKDTRE